MSYDCKSHNHIYPIPCSSICLCFTLILVMKLSGCNVFYILLVRPSGCAGGIIIMLQGEGSAGRVRIPIDILIFTLVSEKYKSSYSPISYELNSR